MVLKIFALKVAFPFKVDVEVTDSVGVVSSPPFESVAVESSSEVPATPDHLTRAVFVEDPGPVTIVLRFLAVPEESSQFSVVPEQYKIPPEPPFGIPTGTCVAFGMKTTFCPAVVTP